MAGKVAWISIAPVKGMRIQELTEVEVGPDGVPGDREFIVVDDQQTLVNGKKVGPLMEIVPEYRLDAGELKLTFPDGSVVGSAVETGDPEEISFFTMPLQARPVSGPFSEAISDHCGARLKLMTRPEGRPGVDRGEYGSVTLLGTASMDRLAQARVDFGDADQPEKVDHRRFRMTFGVEGLDAHEEDSWIETAVGLGAAEVEVRNHVGRCSVTTRDPEHGDVDMKTLHYIRSYRKDVESFEPIPFGVYASVKRAGTVRVGDPVVPAGDVREAAGIS